MSTMAIRHGDSRSAHSSRSFPDKGESCDPADSTQVILDHLWLADAIARRFHGRGEDDEDLRQVARSALLDAARRYDPARGPFVPYAGLTISGVLKRHFRDHGWVVRPPRQTQQVAVLITQHWSGIAQDHQMVPSDQDLADSLNEPVTSIREARRASQGYRTVPLDAASVPIAVTADDDPGFERCEARLLVLQTWGLLDQRERDLLWMRYWEGRSQSDIAERIGTSQMQVSRLLSRTLRRLREHLTRDDEYGGAVGQ
ncbi:MAG: sigma-70 family RNA polymerase sigma factor [Microlunatus sp.]|nr:sigma-70 family RNA polymerase sigma factor [Microlunatus sp.]